MKHYKEKVSAFVNQELSEDERQTVAEHLLICEECRREHDAISLGASFAAQLRQAEAPNATWSNIADALDSKTATPIGLIPTVSFFDLRKGFAFAAAIIAVSAISFLVYLGLFSGDSPYTAQGNGPQGVEVNVTQPQNTPQGVNTSSPQTDTNVNTNTNQQPQPEIKDGWQVETIAGTPKVGDGTEAAKIAVGELLETDATSSARISVADIGTVDIAPSSRVKLIGTGKDEHRLSLEKGKLHAKIYAPPRLFVVDTPSGKAVDLGCEYTLEVDKQGNSILNVTGGFVALERGGRESIVPAGMKCQMRKGRGLGTPFSAEATESFKKALERFDFAGGAVQDILKEAEFYDIVTLWHLLSRVPKANRGAVYDELTKFVRPPAGVTREGIISLDKKMLDAWRAEVEGVWFS